MDRWVMLVFLLAGMVGCRSVISSRPTTAPATRPVEPQYRRVSVLLDFEAETDGLFVATSPVEARRDEGCVRNGNGALLLEAGTERVTVKFSSLMSGRVFPGGWTLVGPHVYVLEPTQVVVSLRSGERVRASRTVLAEPGEWRPVLVDLGPLREGGEDSDLVLTIDFPTPLGSYVWVDDLLLVDNTKVLVDPSEGVDGEGWSLKREGLNYVGDRQGKFHFLLPTEDLAGGWRAEEANRLRACFESQGATKRLTIYEDGRSYWDGKYQSMGVLEGGEEYEAQQGRPAEVRVPEEQGRVDRNTPGDEDHDGYNEGTGAYEVVASGRRVEITVTPRTDGLLRPVLEVKGLPPGDVRATVEGSLAADVLRLGDGRALIVVPARILRETAIEVRVR